MRWRNRTTGGRMNIELSEEDKAIAKKAAELIARDYGEVLRKLAET